jgi:60 kDa SS-A/Ro ribonucleoprotein
VAKFNPKRTGASPAGGSQTTNKEGAPAYTLSKKMELYTAAVTSTLSDNFYESSDDRVERIRNLVSQCNPVFVAKLAVYTREQMYLRSMPLVLTVELAKVHRGDNLVSKLTGRVVKRVDEITELLAYYQLANQREGTKKLNKLSKQIKVGLGIAFNKFDEYQFSKYDRDGEVSLKDALFLVHPKRSTPENKELFDKIIKDELATPYTWETELSKFGQQKFQSDEEKKAALKARWEEIIDSGKLGYMALLRNLRNILEAGVSKQHIAKVTQRLSDNREVANSKQLPFRFLSAYKVLVEPNEKHPVKLHSFSAPAILEALEEAVKASIVNLASFGLQDDIIIAIDTSSSMSSPISQKSSIRNYEVGMILGMILQYKCKSVQTGIFGNTWKFIKMPKEQILANTLETAHRIGEVGHSTNGWLVPEDLLEKKIVANKIMIFTDCQLWDSTSDDYIVGSHRSSQTHNFKKSWHAYKKFSPNTRLYLFDVSGYGDTPISTAGKDVHLIAGWSDKVFGVLEAIENGSSALAQIEAIDL